MTILSGNSTIGEKKKMDEQPNDHDKPPTAFEVMLSVMAAAFGVQNSKNRERDFSQGNPLVFIMAGLIFTVLFVLSVIGVVYLVL